MSAHLSVTSAWFPPGVHIAPHVHDEPTLAVMLEGGFDLRLTARPASRHRSIECTPGVVFLEPAREKHENRLSAHGAHVLVVQPNVAGAEWPQSCASVFNQAAHFHSALMETRAWRLSHELSDPDDLTPLAAEGLALELIVESVRRLDQSRYSSGAPAWQKIVLELIHDRFREPLRIADIASAAGVHASTLVAGFRRWQKIPLATYLRQLRVEWTADRLAHSDDSLVTIATQAGFADQAHLTRVFRRMTGTTPTTYRRLFKRR